MISEGEKNTWRKELLLEMKDNLSWGMKRCVWRCTRRENIKDHHKSFTSEKGRSSCIVIIHYWIIINCPMIMNGIGKRLISFFLLIDMIFLKQNAVITLFCFLYCLWIYSYWHLDCWGGGDTEEEIDCNDDLRWLRPGAEPNGPRGVPRHPAQYVFLLLNPMLSPYRNPPWPKLVYP